MDDPDVSREARPKVPCKAGVYSGAERSQPLLACDDAAGQGPIKSVLIVIGKVENADRPSVAQRIAAKAFVAVDGDHRSDLPKCRYRGDSGQNSCEQPDGGNALSGAVPP